MTLPELAKRLKKATSTIYAWADNGVPVKGQRVYLHTVRIGGRRHVTARDFREFKAACNPEPAPVHVPASKRLGQNAKERARKALASLKC